MIDIERVVREVLAELAAAQERGAERGERSRDGGENSRELTAPGASGESTKYEVQSTECSVGAETPDPSTPSHTRRPPSLDVSLVLHCRVVTMAEVPQLDGVRRLVVPRGAIVTPAVQDELRRRGIDVGESDQTDGEPAAALRIVVGPLSAEFNLTTLVAAMAREGFHAKCVTTTCLIAAVDRLAADVSAGETLGVLLTSHVPAAMCLANRITGVRAIARHAGAAGDEAAAAVGANLLIADPKAGSLFELKRCVVEFARGGVRPCPERFSRSTCVSVAVSKIRCQFES